MPQKHLERKEPAEPEPSAPQPPWLVRQWIYVRGGLQLVELLIPETHQGLHLAAQTLVMLGDLTVVLVSRRSDR
jgi:hypothetical protein